MKILTEFIDLLAMTLIIYCIECDYDAKGHL